MKKLGLILCNLCLVVCTFSQTTYDVFTYTEPKGYKKEVSNSLVKYTKLNNSNYCQIYFYAAQPSKGSLQADFDNEWNSLTAKTFSITVKPKQEESAAISGWHVMQGSSTYTANGNNAALLHYVFSNNNNATSLVIITNNTSYQDDIVKLIGSLKLQENNTTPLNLNEVKQASNSILGEWYLSDGNAKITLLFGANGRYDQGTLVDRRIVSNLYETTTIKGKGTYTLNGSALTLIPTTGSKEVYQIRFTTDNDSERKPQPILHLKRPVAGGQMYESDYYFVPQKNASTSNTTIPITTNAASSFNFLNGSGITGVWVAYKKGTFTYSDFSWYWLVFFNNGKSLGNMPNGGFANLQKDQYFDIVRNNKEAFSIGTYSYNNGNGINIAYDGSPWKDKIELVKSPNQIKVDGANYMKCSSVNGQKLSGSFTTFGNIADATINQSSGFRSVITFTADGKFVDEGIYQVLLKDYGKSEAYNAAGKGTYELKDYSIILKFDDGRTKQEAFSMPFSYTTNNTTVILIGTAQLNKMK